MKPPPRFPALLAMVALVVAPLAPADIEFVGILVMPQKTLFALNDTATDRSTWVSLGDTFAEQKLAAYDRATDTLTFTKAGAETHVRLKDDAKIKSARLELTGTVTLGGDDPVEIARVTLICDQENVFPLKDGIVYRITPTRHDDGTLHYGIAIERLLAPNRTERLSAPAVITRPGQPFSVRMEDVGFAFKPL